MALIVGLGNPGKEYAGTRHNIGFELIDRIAEKLSIPLRPGNGPFLFAETSFKGSPLKLLKPLTYMNRSGTALRALLRDHPTPTDRILVCYDDLNLDPGIIRLRAKGSAGGHNGLSDIMEVLQTRQIPRLRIGIGNNFDRGRQSDYVLSGFDPEERLLMDETLDRAAEAVFTFARAGITRAMNQYN